MKHDVDQGRKMVEKEVLLPEGRPREIEEQGSHFEANNDQQRAKDTVHGYEGIACISECRVSADGLLKSSNAVSDITVVNVHRVDLRETLERCFRLTCGFLGNA